MSDPAVDPLQELDELAARAPQTIEQAGSLQALEEQRVAWLGRKSRLTELMKLIPQVPPDRRGEFGKRLNQLKVSLEGALEARRAALASAPATAAIDLTLPGSAVAQGRLHPITLTIDAVLEIFTAMGFEVGEGPEAELEHYNFDALNVPKDHPSRESFDTFFVDHPSPDPRKGRLVLRSHTSPVWARALEVRRPPMRLVVPGVVYRPDPLDPSHSFMFHQIDGLMVDGRASFADLKGVLEQFLKALFGAQTATRFRPHFFPFTEPSAEVDIACSVCHGAGCSTCGRKGWLEIMGCGMVHPNVLKTAGYARSGLHRGGRGVPAAVGGRPRDVQGFAFGMGIERIAMLKHGVRDIRLFFENDVRFLKQF